MFLFCLVFAMFCARLFICALWSPAGKGLTSWLSFVVSSVSLSLSHWYPGSGVVLDCIDSWSLQPYYFVFAMPLCASIHMCLVVTCWENKRLSSWLSFVVSNCEFVTFPLVSRVRRGTWLYRFLIFAPLLTLRFSLYSTPKYGRCFSF